MYGQGDLHASSKVAVKRVNRRKALTIAMIGAGAGGALAACGSHPIGRGAHEPGATRATVSAGKPRYGGQLNAAWTTDPPTYDAATKLSPPQQATHFTNDLLLVNTFGTGAKSAELTLQPWLAERWETPDAQTYTLYLRQGVNFANLPPLNGRAFTLADVRWTLEYMARIGDLKNLPKAVSASMFEGLDRVETPDAATVVAHFAEPFAPFTSYISSAFCPMLAHEIYDEDGAFTKHAMGTGPWQLDTNATQIGVQYAFKKNPTYFMNGRPHIDQIRFLILSDDATTMAAFAAKQVDLVSSSTLRFELAQSAKKTNPDTAVQTYPSIGEVYMYMNVSKPPLDDVRIRKAIALCIDRDEFIKTLSHGTGEWALAGGMPGLFTAHEASRF